MRPLATTLAVIATVLATNATPVPRDRDVGAAPVRIEYGEGKSQFGELWLPPDRSAGDSSAVVVLIHGGFWRTTYGLDLMDPLAADLVERGVAVWNVEYGRVGRPGGGWPGTLTDVAAAVDEISAIAIDHHLDAGDVAVVGHSAGGHLALWVANRQLRVAGVPGADPIITPRLAVGDCCPACGDSLLDTDHEPQSPHEWEQWFMTARRTLRKQRIVQQTDPQPDERSSYRLLTLTATGVKPARQEPSDQPRHHPCRPPRLA